MHIRNSDDGSNRCDIGNLRRSSATPICMVETVWPSIRVPEVFIMVVKATSPWAIPAIGISMGVVVIWLRFKRWAGLGGRGA